MLIDELEEAGKRISQLHEKLRELDRQYRISYDRDIRQEMDGVKKTIRRERAKVREEIYLNLQELNLIRKHFPELFAVLAEYEEIGPVVGGMAWLLDFQPRPGKKDAFEKLRQQREGLAKSREFLASWAGPIDARALEATWPQLKGKLQDAMDRDEALRVIEETDRQIRRQGWLLLLNEPYIHSILQRFLRRYQKARSAERQAKARIEEAQGHGSVSEYDAVRQYHEAVRQRQHWERYIRHILLVNQPFREGLVKERINWKDSKMTAMVRALVMNVAPRTVIERTWLGQMRDRIGQSQKG